MLSTQWIIPLIRGPRANIARVQDERVRSATGDEASALSLPAGSDVRVCEEAVPGVFGRSPYLVETVFALSAEAA